MLDHVPAFSRSCVTEGALIGSFVVVRRGDMAPERGLRAEDVMAHWTNCATTEACDGTVVEGIKSSCRHAKFIIRESYEEGKIIFYKQIFGF